MEVKEMNYEEFIKIAGYEVSFETYKKVIEPMYMSTDIIDKKEFCKSFSKKLFGIKSTDKLLKEINKTAKFMKENTDRELQRKAWYEFKELCEDYTKRTYLANYYTYDKDEDNGFWSYPTVIRIWKKSEEGFNEYPLELKTYKIPF